LINKFHIVIVALLLSSCALLNTYQTKQTPFKKWKNTPIFKNFVSPWNEKEDQDIQISDASIKDELNVLQSDRVELFFAKDSLMQPYYTFEMDAANRLFDARCTILTNNKSNLNHSKQINSDWQIDKDDLQFNATIINNGYKIEGKIAMTFLQEKQLVMHNKLWCGIQRADFNTNAPVQWICAKDPKTKKPDFHCWGVFVELSINDN